MSTPQRPSKRPTRVRKTLYVCLCGEFLKFSPKRGNFCEKCDK